MKPFQSLVVVLLAVALGVIASQFLGTDQLRQFGEVIYRHGGNDYRSTVPQVALMVLVAVLVLWLLWSLLASPFRAWGRYRRKQGRARLIEGIQAHEQGQWQRAEKLLDSAAEDKEVTAVAMVTAAFPLPGASAAGPSLQRRPPATRPAPGCSHAARAAPAAHRGSCAGSCRYQPCVTPRSARPAASAMPWVTPGCGVKPAIAPKALNGSSTSTGRLIIAATRSGVWA